MFSGICAVVPPELVRRCHVHFLKEKGQITTLPKDATPKKFFLHWNLKCFYLDFYPKTESRSQWTWSVIFWHNITFHKIMSISIISLRWLVSRIFSDFILSNFWKYLAYMQESWLSLMFMHFLHVYH